MEGTRRTFFTAGGFLSFFVFGFVDNLKGPLLPELLRGGQFSDSQGGTIILAGYLGFILATLITGILADRISNATILCFAGLSLFAGGIGFGMASSFVVLTVSMSVTGIGLGAIELGANGLMVQLHRESRGRYLNLLAMFHGWGSLLVPLYAAWLIQRGIGWQAIYFTSAILAVPLLILFRPSGWKARDKSENRSNPRSWDWRGLGRVGFTRRMNLFYLSIASYVAVELGVASWMMEFLQRERGVSATISSFYLSGFFVLLMLGRFMGAMVVERVDYMLAVMFALVGSSICLTAALFGPAWLLVLLPVSGLFMSIVFPTVTAVVSRSVPSNSGAVMGILFAAGGMGGAIGPWTIGFVSDRLGLQLGLASSIIFALVSLAGLASLRLADSKLAA